MTFMELLTKIEEDGEFIYSHLYSQILTETKRYVLASANNWTLSEVEGRLMSRAGRGGLQYYWGDLPSEEK